MTWLTWRQFRAQAVTAVVGLVVLAVFLLYLGTAIRDLAGDWVGPAAALGRSMENDFVVPVMLGGLALVLVPALIGAFWGAPLVARELESGTHRLVWNQSVTRGRWLAVKLSVVLLAGVAVAGVSSLLLTWAASPYDAQLGNRFGVLMFPARNVVPLGYAALAVVLGTVVGLLARRVLPAMAITIAVLVGLQILVPQFVRPYLVPPVTETIAFDWRGGDGLELSRTPDGIFVGHYGPPGAWLLSGRAPLLDASGQPVSLDLVDPCLMGDFERDMACLAGLDLHIEVTYQPAERYWTFQWLELGGYLALTALLAGYAFRRIRRDLT